MKAILKEAGLPPHPVPRFASHLCHLAIANGFDVKTLASMLGHHSAGFTLDTYTHATMKIQIEASDKLGGFMAQTV